MTKNRRARKLKISENTPRYPYFLVLKFQPDRTWFDPFFSVIFQNREINYAPPVLQKIRTVNCSYSWRIELLSLM